MSFIKTCFFILTFLILPIKENFLLPVNFNDRKNISLIRLTEIGEFSLYRKARKTVPGHLHTGIDIKRPVKNYNNEPIFSIAEGKVISIRTDGAYAQIIIEHQFENYQIWSLYEHIAGIKVKVNEVVGTKKTIARFMNKAELDKFGWQFDHFHLEILKLKPSALKPSKSQPERYYNSFSLICFNKEDLYKYYYDPMEFLSQRLYK